MLGGLGVEASVGSLWDIRYAINCLSQVKGIDQNDFILNDIMFKWS